MQYLSRICLVVSFALALCACQSAKSGNTPASSATWQEGTYEIDEGDYYASLTITQLSEAGFVFSITVSTPDACTGTLEGKVSLTEETQAQYQDEHCQGLSFSLTGSSIAVKEQDCGYHHGINCDFEGKYEFNDKEERKSSQLCFEKTVKHDPMVIDGKVVQEMIDTALLSLTVEGTKVSGTYNIMPAEQDHTVGSFEGSQNAQGEIEAIYSYSQEGEEYQLGLLIVLEGNIALVSFAELKEEEGTWVLDRDTEGEIEALKKISCQ